MISENLDTKTFVTIVVIVCLRPVRDGFASLIDSQNLHVKKRLALISHANSEG